MKSMEEMMKAAQEAAQTVQTQMEEAQKKLDSLEVEGKSGGGLVSVKATAKGRILGVSIDDSLIKAEEKGILEDLVAAAFNDARDKADALSNQEMSKMTSGMQLPPGFKLPF
ncbi:YbaB/EbfC family nucleoid-associated protein [Parasphingorhabdus halotolerans]|uniref:Nucleoid-associated protein HF685_03125 n=1 Tax=Parasphingorhabdus halotolerans TaxID=2725558 RepID=A0A6H2DIC4_9SPHN|nr:YbaB/EbfC family nucleoid-associated protein [Parasphingorhabdus halotolerans]QJB68419.1 YbaB/EbfC family nucleoid-associated protein [Parasphingorhabdus halotolerans]